MDHLSKVIPLDSELQCIDPWMSDWGAPRVTTPVVLLLIPLSLSSRRQRCAEHVLVFLISRKFYLGKQLRT